MAPIVHDETCALHKDAVAARVLADKVRHEATMLGFDHFDFLVRARRHRFKTGIGTARRQRVYFTAF